jgi:hypothetical protein
MYKKELAGITSYEAIPANSFIYSANYPIPAISLPTISAARATHRVQGRNL